jgi:hypothetical protein
MSSPIKLKLLGVSLILLTFFLFGCKSDSQKVENTSITQKTENISNTQKAENAPDRQETDKSPDRDRVRKLSVEGDALIDSGGKLAQEGYQKLRAYMTDAMTTDFPSNREQIKGAAQEAADLYAKAAVAYRDGASKFEEVSKLNFPDVVKEFYSLKSQGNRKRADALDSTKEMALLPLDPSINDSSTLGARIRNAQGQINVYMKEADALHEQANKLKEANP